MLMVNSVKDKILKLREIISQHNSHYYTHDNPTITDAEYDRLIKELRQLESKNPELITPDSPSQVVGGEVLTAFTKVNHEVPMLSLGNVFSKEELSDFITRLTNRLDNPEELLFCVEPNLMDLL